MTSAHAVRPTYRSLWVALSVLSSLAACGGDNSSAGGLVVRVESDLSMPKDFDRITLEITQSGTLLLSKDSPVGEGQLLLPAEFPIGPTAGALPVTVHGVAYSKGHPVIERTVVTPVPATHVALLHLPLNYLCLGTTHEDGSSTCGADETCNQGLCASTAAADSDLTDFDSPEARAAARSAAAGGNAKCFDVLQCMADAAKATLDASCSFTVPAAAQQGRLNVAIKLPLGSSGVCGAGACWVALDSGADGWTQTGAQVTLPASVCRDRPNLPVLEVAFSTQCAAKTSVSPPCGSWSSITDPLPASGVMMNSSTMGGGPPVFVGNACEGLPTEACGDCGTHTRTCQNGTWSAWSDCVNGGVCEIAATQPCGAGGTELCDSSCQWGQCVGQTCYGPAIQACGNCGTQRRTCDATTASWSPWGACTDQGVCAPGATEKCGTNGTHACGGNCQWGACGSQVCAGAPSAACGNCGSQTRTCDSITAKWSDFSACAMEGACKPNATRACGSSGAQVCGGNCQWDATCGGQMCSGAPTQACGNCGAQTRACDMTTGKWSDWTACLGSGSCAPKQTRSCGAGGTQTCGDNCQWNPECVGQTCAGAMTQTCGMCGTQSRTCDSGSGKWSDWGACGNQGACAPGATAACGANMTGTKSCGINCQWDISACGKTCTGTAPIESCGNCGMHSRKCDPATGTWTGAYTDCTGEGVCSGKQTAPCGAGMTGTKSCNANTCQWDTAACVKTCDGTAPTKSCGLCGTQLLTCDPASGTWTGPPTACTSEGVCSAGQTAACGAGMTGNKTCNATTCQWDTSACVTQMACPGTAPVQSCGMCGTQSPTCDTTRGTWTGPPTACAGEHGVCTGTASADCPTGSGKMTCNPNTCQWDTSKCPMACPGTAPILSCGMCGTQSPTCDTAFGTWTGPMTKCAGEHGVCSGTETAACGANMTGNKTCNASTCQWDTSACNAVSMCAGVPLTQACANCPAQCGACPTQTRTCDETTGPSAWTPATCPAPACTQPGSARACNLPVGGTQTCSNSCTLGDCTCPNSKPDTCNNTCVDTQTDPSNCGGCNNACPSGRCNAGNCVVVAPPDAGAPPISIQRGGAGVGG
jgi:hypothetical protein